MTLRDLATTWIEANCPSKDLQNDFLRRLDEALMRSVGCSFIVGGQLTWAAKPYLVYCYCGEFFAFQLTPQQAASLNVQKNVLVSSFGLQRQNHQPRPQPLVQLKQVTIDHAERLDGSSSINGAISYWSDPMWALPLAVQVVCEPPGRNSTTLYHHFDRLSQGEGTLHFTLSPISTVGDPFGVREAQAFEGVIPLFVQIGIVGEPEASSILHGPGIPEPPVFMHPHPLPPLPIAFPVVRQPLGEPFVPPSPLPSRMTPDTMSFPPRQDAQPLVPLAAPSGRFRTISDIGVVLVQFA